MSNEINVEGTIIDKIRKYIATCPYLKDGKIGVDYLDNKETAYSIEPIPIKPIHSDFIDGSGTEQYAFVFASRESYGSETVQNMLNSSFYELFSKWIKQNNRNGILPEIKTGEILKANSVLKILGHLIL